MAPEIRRVAPAKRAVLEKEVILAVVKCEAVRVVQPPAPRGEMKLRTQRFAVEIFHARRGVALRDLRQPARVAPHFVDRDDQRLSTPRADVERRPPIRLRVREFDFKSALGLAVAERRERHRPFLRAVFHGEIQPLVCGHEFARDLRQQPRGERRLGVGENDLVHVDVSPAAASGVHDFEARGFARKLAHIPAARLQLFGAAGFGVRPRRRAHDFAIDEQIDARLPLPAPASNEKGNELPLDRKLRRSQLPRRPVAAFERVRQTLPAKTFDHPLIGKFPARRSRPKGRAFDFPRAVIGTFKIGEDLVLRSAAMRRSGGERRQEQEKCGRFQASMLRVAAPH